MTSSSNRDLEQKLQELETELHQTSSNPQEANTQANTSNPNIQSDSSTASVLDFDRITTTLTTTFNRLPPVGKVLVVLFSACLVLSIVSGVLRLLTSLMVLGIIGVLGYCAYQWFFTD